jgi:hypothetical protein
MSRLVCDGARGGGPKRFRRIWGSIQRLRVAYGIVNFALSREPISSFNSRDVPLLPQPKDDEQDSEDPSGAADRFLL